MEERLRALELQVARSESRISTAWKAAMIGLAALLGLWGYTNFQTVPAQAAKALEDSSFKTVMASAEAELEAAKRLRKELEAQKGTRIDFRHASFGALHAIHLGCSESSLFSSAACINAMLAVCRREFGPSSAAVLQDIDGNTGEPTFACIR